RLQAGCGHVARPALLQRCGRAVTVAADAIEQRGGRTAGAHGVELIARVLDRFVHSSAGLSDQFRGRRHQRPPSPVMIVPTRSPVTTRWMFPGALSKT